MAGTTLALASPAAPGKPWLAALQLARAVPWVVAALCAGLAIQAEGVARWALAAGAVLGAGVATTYRRFLADHARSSAVPAEGSVEMTADHLVVRHAGVLATDIAVPWSVVRALCIDDGTREGAEADGRPTSPPRRFVVPATDDAEVPARPAALFAPTGSRRRVAGVPLVAAAPAVPNVLVLVEPPVEVPWRYPFIAGPLNPPWGVAWPARPWPSPALTPAFLLAVEDVDALRAAAATRVPVRDLGDGDCRYLEACGVLTARR